MTDLSQHPLEVLVDMTRTTQAQGRMAGATRVEAEFASALLRSHPDSVIPISWSSVDDAFVEFDRETAERYCQLGGSVGAEANGRRLARRPDPSLRRIILVTGAGWLSNIKLLHGLLATRRDLEAELHVVVHDLVHVLFPQWAPGDEVAKCRSAHEAILAGADRVLVYSNSTASDIARVTEQRGFPRPDIARMALGTAFLSAATPVTPARALDGIADRPFVLYVSTVAARKNHEFIAQVWSRLASELGTRLPRLVFVGRVAADQAAAMDRLSRDPSLTDRLIHISGATDEHLAWLYDRCLFTVFPSLYEGWGLPVAESLALGRLCLSSSSSSIPEVGGGLTPLLDPLDISNWCEAIKRYLDADVRADAERRIREEYRPVSWESAAESLWQSMLPPVARERRRPAVRVAAATAVVQPLEPLVVAREPWTPMRSPLAAIEGLRSRLAVQLDRVPPYGIRLGLTLRGSGRVATRVETEVNDLVIDGCLVDPDRSVVRQFDLPRDVLLVRGVVDVVTVCRQDAAAPAVPDPPVAIEAISAVELDRDQEVAAIEVRRSAWRINDIHYFVTGSRHLGLLKHGWDDAASWGVWSVEPRAVVSFRPVPQPTEPLLVRAIVRGFVPPVQPALDVDVFVRGSHLTTWSFRHPADFSFVERTVVIPPELVVDGIAEIELAIPGCRSPRELGMSEDERRLGVGLARAICVTGDPGRSIDWHRARRR